VNWPAEITETPFGQLPVLIEYLPNDSEIRISQSQSIIRYLARKFSLNGSNEIEATILDSINETLGKYPV